MPYQITIARRNCQWSLLFLLRITHLCMDYEAFPNLRRGTDCMINLLAQSHGEPNHFLGKLGSRIVRLRQLDTQLIHFRRSGLDYLSGVPTKYEASFRTMTNLRDKHRFCGSTVRSIQMPVVLRDVRERGTHLSFDFSSEALAVGVYKYCGCRSGVLTNRRLRRPIVPSLTKRLSWIPNRTVPGRHSAFKVV